MHMHQYNAVTHISGVSLFYGTECFVALLSGTLQLLNMQNLLVGTVE